MEKHKIPEEFDHLKVEINKPVLDQDNARLHTENQLLAFEDSLDKFGQRAPISLQRGTDIVMAGNGRLKAARRLGWTHIAVVYYDDSDEMMRAFALSDNRLQDMSSFDPEAVFRHLEELPEDAVVGFDDDYRDMLAAMNDFGGIDLDDMVDQAEPEGEKNVDETICSKCKRPL